MHTTTINNKKLIQFKPDWLILSALLLLSGIGLLFIYSAEYNPANEDFGWDNFPLFIKQLIFLIPSLIALSIALVWNYKSMTKYVWYFYFITIFLLILVLIVGEARNGSKSWINVIPGFGIQPSEFAKPVLILTLAYYMNSKQKEMLHIFSFLISLLICAPILGLIFLQPDFGTIIIFIPIIFIMLFMGGANVRDLIILLVTGISAIILGILGLGMEIASRLQDISLLNIDQAGKDLVLGIANASNGIGDWLSDYAFVIPMIFAFIAFAGLNYLFFKRSRQRLFEIIMAVFLGISIGWGLSFAFRAAIKDYHIDRLVSTLVQSMDVGYYNRDVGYQTNRSIIAIGAGGWGGQGFLEGRQKQGGFVPERHTDFIFTVIAEEIGFRGSLLILLLYIIIAVRGISISYIVKDKMGSLIVIGITGMITSQALINLASCSGLFPVTGLPLPLISAGGSSMITTMFSLGILMNVSGSRFLRNK